MITGGYLSSMSRYNRWQNEALITAASRLTPAERACDRGAFWGSIQGTFSHLYWADRIWMSRFRQATAPSVGLKQSATFLSDWDELRASRIELDDQLVGWCDQWSRGSVEGVLSWFSGAAQRDVTAPCSLILVHIFNHQAHHRGQLHAMITAAGAATIDTDLFLMPTELWPPS